MTTAELVPHRARIAEIVEESSDTRTFTFEPDPPLPAFDGARPGQFAMLSLLGHGEAAFTLSALPAEAAAWGTVVMTVRRVGSLTAALFALAPGARVGLRGPYGRGFPDEPNEPTVYLAGGCGLSPLKAAITHQLAARSRRAPVAIVYGARDPDSRIHRAALAVWERTPDVHLIECVETTGPGWTGRVGRVIDFVDEAVAAAGARRAAVCGPPVMLPRVAEALRRAGVQAARVHVAIERYMKCGTGLCGHCYVDNRYVCTDGPVFTYAELAGMRDGFGGEERAGR